MLYFLKYTLFHTVSEWFTFLNMLRELGCLDLAGALGSRETAPTLNEDEGINVCMCVCGCVAPGPTDTSAAWWKAHDPFSK